MGKLLNKNSGMSSVWMSQEREGQPFAATLCSGITKSNHQYTSTLFGLVPFAPTTALLGQTKASTPINYE
jgi:hypothetical protein